MLPEDSRITQCQLPEGVNRTNDQCHPSANCIQGISGIFRHLTESDLLETVVNCIQDQCCPRAPESYNVSCPRAPELNKKYLHRNRCKLRQRPMLPEGSRITQCQLPEGSRIKVRKEFHRSGSEQNQRPMPYKCELQPRNLWHSPAAPENIHPVSSILCAPTHALRSLTLSDLSSCVRRPTLSALYALRD